MGVGETVDLDDHFPIRNASKSAKMLSGLLKDHEQIHQIVRQIAVNDESKDCLRGIAHKLTEMMKGASADEFSDFNL